MVWCSCYLKGVFGMIMRKDPTDLGHTVKYEDMAGSFSEDAVEGAWPAVWLGGTAAIPLVFHP